MSARLDFSVPYEIHNLFWAGFCSEQNGYSINGSGHVAYKTEHITYQIPHFTHNFAHHNNNKSKHMTYNTIAHIVDGIVQSAN